MPIPFAIILPLLRSYWSYGALAGLALLAWHFDARAVANANAMRAQAMQFKDAQRAAQTIAQDALNHQEAAYATKALEADNAYQSSLADARGSAVAYIAAHRIDGVRTTAVAGSAGPAAARPQGDGPGLPAPVPSDSVVVSANDVQACTDAVTYAARAHDWAATINP